MIEITNTLSKETEEGEAGIESYKIEGLDNTLADEVKRMRNEDVAFDLKLYVEMRASMNDQVVPNAAEQLGKKIASALRIQERTSWIYANTVVEVLTLWFLERCGLMSGQTSPSQSSHTPQPMTLL